MATVLDLSGTWACRVRGGGHDCDIDGTVPGCVHIDLIRAGRLPDLYWRTNNDLAAWVENCDVEYTRTFELDAVPENLYVRFGGLDTYCDVYLNGVKIGAADNMFIPWEFSVGEAARVGENVLSVQFRSPVREVADRPAREGAFTTERMHSRRMQCTYGWDWVARFVTMGIFRGVSLGTRDADRPEHTYVYTESINSYAAKIRIRVAFADLTGDGWAEFRITDPDGKTVFRKSRRLLPTVKGSCDTVIEERVDIPDAKLWWPAGYGEQPLYTLTVRTGGQTAESVRFGIRTAEILEIEDAPDAKEAALADGLKKLPHFVMWDKNEGSSGFALLINGVRIFCSGANYVPAEPFPSEETEEKLEKLAVLARAGHFRMLRVWGGGMFAPQALYDACDRLGILVTQDFLMACGDYPEEDDAFIDQLKKEARTAALTLRNHPSLVWWTGDNENAIYGDENQPSYRGRRAALEGIAPILAELDPARRFLPSSPYGGVLYSSGVRGTSHVTQYLGFIFDYIEKGDFSDYRHYFDGYLCRFCAEYPAMGMPYVTTLRRFMTEEDIFGEDTSVSEYHTKSNPALAISLYGYIDRLTRGIFGEYKDGADRVRKMQMLQCERIRISMELYRRNMWYASGIVYWMFNDCWPAANSWSVVDYYCAPKPAYYMFKRCAGPVVASVTDTADTYCAYVSHTGAGSASGRGRLYVYNVRTGEESFSRECAYSAANSAVCALTVEKETLRPYLTEETVILFEIDGDRAYLLPHAYTGTAWEEGGFTVLSEDADSVTVRADVCLPMLLLDMPYMLEKNGFFMKKGETVTVRKQPVL